MPARFGRIVGRCYGVNSWDLLTNGSFIIERNDELVRSALRAVVAISKVENVDSNIKFEEFTRTTVKTGDLAEKYEAIRVAEEGEHTTDAMDTS